MRLRHLELHVLLWHVARMNWLQVTQTQTVTKLFVVPYGNAKATYKERRNKLKPFLARELRLRFEAQYGI